MLTLSRPNTRSLLIAGALLLASAPAFAQQQDGGGGRGGAGGGSSASESGGGGSDVYELINKDPFKPTIVCPATFCVETKPRPRPSRVVTRPTTDPGSRGMCMSRVFDMQSQQVLTVRHACTDQRFL